MASSKRNWPTGRGFERYYGFLGGETNQWYPTWCRTSSSSSSPTTRHGRSGPTARRRLPPLEGPGRPGHRHDRRRQAGRSGAAVLHVLLPRRQPRPAPRAQGVGGQVQGQVRHGLREDPRDDPGQAEGDGHRAGEHRAVARSTRCADETSVDGKPLAPVDIVRPWDSLSEDEKTLFVRMAEVYAGFCSYTDHEIGRLIDYLEETGELDNTHDRRHLRQRRLGRGRPERLGQREQVLQQRPDDMAENLKLPRRARLARRPTTTTRSAGRWPSTRRSSCSSGTPGRAASATR